MNDQNKNPKVILHIDMDAFFASVEQRDDPKLLGFPVVIGADPKGGKGRGVVSTCSYEARKYGIHSAQPISIAYKRCPHAVFLRGSHAKYSEVSDQILDIFYDFTPDIEPVSIDEAFLDITGSYHFYKTPYNTAVEIKKQIKERVRLTASIGIAPLKMVAKIASDLCKPDGLLEVKEENLMEFLWPLPIEKLWGVGPKSQQALNNMGIRTIMELAKAPLEDLLERFGENGQHLHDLANGIDPRNVELNDEVKSISHEHTFEKDTKDQEKIHSALLYLSEKVSRRLRKEELKGRTLTVKIRLKGFKTYTRAHAFSKRTNLIDDIYNKAKEVYDDFYKTGQHIRLIGVRVSNFNDLYVQDSLFSDKASDRKEDIHKAIDTIKDRFGERAIHRGL